MEIDKCEVTIRPAVRSDCESIMKLKVELAIHSKMDHLTMLTAKELERDGFDENPPCFQCLVAEVEPASATNGSSETTSSTEDSPVRKVVGYALYFYAYAAWEGKTMLLEDLCVSKSLRGGGVGTKLIKQLAKIALEEKCSRIQFEVLDWNPARKFYDGLGGWNTTEGEGWHNFRLSLDGIKKLMSSN